MRDVIVADRYLLDGELRWLDLVTGDRVAGRQDRGVVAPERVDACVEAHAVWRDGRSRLIDWGSPALERWFEVWNAPPPGGEPRFSLRHIGRPAVDAIVEQAVAHHEEGPKVITLLTRPRAGTRSVLSEAARALRGVGYVTIRSDLRVPRDVRAAFSHRHVALIDTARARRLGSTASWLDALVRVSNRGHLVIAVVSAREGRAARLAGTGSSPEIELTPCDTSLLVEAFVPGAWTPESSAIDAAADESGGWPGRFADALGRTWVLSSVDSASAALSRRVSFPQHQWPAPAPLGVVRDAPIDAAMLSRPGEGERALSHRSASTVRGRVDEARLLRRAHGLARRGRQASADAWFGAALAAARRRRDDRGALAAFEHVADGRSRRGDVDRLWTEADDVGRELRTPAGRVALAETAARACLRSGDPRRAAALLATAAAESALAGAALSDRHLALRAELRFWQGRFAEGLAEITARADAAALTAWRTLLAWGARDRTTVAETVAALEAPPGAICGGATLPVRAAHQSPDVPWVAVAHALGTAFLGDRDAAATRLCDMDRIVRELPSADGRALARAARLAIHGADGEPTRQRGRRHASSHAVTVFGLLEQWLAHEGDGGRGGSRHHALQIGRAVKRRGLDGFRRWKKGRQAMVVLDDVSALLEMVHDADDETVALAKACAWARAAARATGVGIFAIDGLRLLAGDLDAGDGIDPLEVAQHPHVGVRLVEAHTLVRAIAQVRYGGVTVAVVIARGTSERASSLSDTARAVASACAPLVRARLDACGIAGDAQALAGEILGVSPAMAAVRAAAARAATTPFPVLIEGESGTGKELVARALHRLGPRRDRRFCGLNCAALTDELLESELFGHARGAFTGAMAMRVGLFEEAHHGSLFLDEVADLSAKAQAKLLRVLQEGEIRRVGENAVRAVDVRVIAATNRPLVAGGLGGFREDLLFRLAVIRVTIPPLRDRIEDVPILAHPLWREASRGAGSRAILGADAIAALCRYHWPGNVRQLQNVLAALAVHAPARGRVLARHVEHVLDVRGGEPAADVSLEVVRSAAERKAVTAALARHAGCRLAAARSLGLSRQGLTKAIRRLGLDAPSASAGAM